MKNKTTGFGGFMSNIMSGFGGKKKSSPPTESVNDDPGPPIYNPMNMPPFSNPEPTPREMPIPSNANNLQNTNLNQNSNNSSMNEIDNLLSNIADSKDLGNEKEITLDLNNF